jgi:hypothetical protein
MGSVVESTRKEGAGEISGPARGITGLHQKDEDVTPSDPGGLFVNEPIDRFYLGIAQAVVGVRESCNPGPLGLQAGSTCSAVSRIEKSPRWP